MVSWTVSNFAKEQRPQWILNEDFEIIVTKIEMRQMLLENGKAKVLNMSKVLQSLAISAKVNKSLMRIKRPWLILGANHQKTLKLECLGCRKKRKGSQGRSISTDTWSNLQRSSALMGCFTMPSCWSGSEPKIQNYWTLWSFLTTPNETETPVHGMLQVQGSNFSHKLLITQLHLSQANCRLTERLLKSVQKHLHSPSQAQTSAIFWSMKLAISVAPARHALCPIKIRLLKPVG